MTNIKEKAIVAIKNLPDNATYEDIFEVIYIQEKIYNALIDSEKGNYISQEEFEAKYSSRIH